MAPLITCFEIERVLFVLALSILSCSLSCLLCTVAQVVNKIRDDDLSVNTDLLTALAIKFT